MQETFLKLLTHLESGGHTANLRGWLFTVAANACRDRMRRRLRWLPWTPANEPSVDTRTAAGRGRPAPGGAPCAAATRAPRSASPHAQSAGTVVSRNLDRRPDTRVVRGPPAGARRGPLGAGHPWPPPLFRTLQEIVMKCLDDAQVQALVDNEAAADVRAHAASCARCAARIEQRRTVIDACPAGAGPSSTDGRHAAATRRTGRRVLLAARRDPAARDWRASRPAGAVLPGAARRSRWRRSQPCSSSCRWSRAPRPCRRPRFWPNRRIGWRRTASAGVELLEYELVLDGVPREMMPDNDNGTYRVSQVIDHNSPGPLPLFELRT